MGLGVGCEVTRGEQGGNVNANWSKGKGKDL